MKVIVPVAGAGTSLRPFTYSNPKPLISVAGKPIIGHIIEKFSKINISDFIFITGYLADKIEQFVHETYKNKINYEFVRQEPRLGLAHAISLTIKKLKYYEGPVIIMLGDTIIDIDFKDFIYNYKNAIAVQKVENPERFGIIELNKQNFITNIIEKPKIPKSNIAVSGLYKFESYKYLIEKCEEIQRKNLMNYGEYHLTDAINLMIKEGLKIRSYYVNHWLDCGTPTTLLETNRVLLSQIWEKKEYSIPENIKKKNIIIPPVFIPEECKIKNSVIGPYVSIGKNVKMQNVLIKNSIVGDTSELTDIMLVDSIIGTDTKISSNWHKINLGDNAELNLGF